MVGRRRAALAALSSIIAAVLVGCGGGSDGAGSADASGSTSTSSGTGQQSGVSAVATVALGDSVPSGGGCGCTPYPQLSATSLTATGPRPVSIANDAVGGFTSGDVVDQLSSDASTESDVTHADVVEVEVGANDVPYGSACGTTVACYQSEIPSLEHNLMQVVARIHDLAHPQPALVVLLDYWSVWLGGQYAESKGPAYVDAAAAVTNDVNTVIRQTASATGSDFVDLRAAFKGPDYAYDETHYLAPDGDHPNALGHQQIAAALVAVLGPRLQDAPST